MSNLTAHEDGTMMLCSSCIGLSSLKQWVSRKGTLGQCSYQLSHNKNNPRKVISVDQLAFKVNKMFRLKYTLWEDLGNYEDFDPLESSLLAFLDLDSDLVINLMNSLVALDRNQGFYNQSHNYVLIEVQEERKRQAFEDYQEFKEWWEERIEFKWSKFCEHVKYRNRYFNTQTLLEELFGSSEKYKQMQFSPIKTIKKGQVIYRARKITEEKDKKKILINPSQEMSAPPKDKAVAGRMNPEYIAVFYGAFSKKVAIAEIQPYLNEEVAVARFTVTRALRLFDFTAYNQIADDDSTDDDDPSRPSRAETIQKIGAEISKPVSLHAKKLEYLPTQIVAEYLKEQYKVDGLIYYSSLFPRKRKLEKNVVIFEPFGLQSDYPVREYKTEFKKDSLEIVKIEELKHKVIISKITPTIDSNDDFFTGKGQYNPSTF